MGTIMRLPLLFICYIGLIIRALAAPTPKVQFVRNDGQWDAAIRFRAEIPGGYLLVKNTGLQYVFLDFPSPHAGNQLDKTHRTKVMNGHSVEMQFVEANPNASIETAKSIETTYNYFYGNDASKWTKNTPVFEEITIKNIYPDIDFRLYGIDQSLKYEYVAKPHADISKIRMKYKGAEKLVLDSQAFTIKTSLNNFKEFQPYSFQKIAGKEQEIKSNFRLENDEIHFEFPEKYDKSQALTIDPQLVFSTYSGSKSDNWGHTATYDADGNLYVGGTVFGSDFPITTGAFQVNLGGASLYSSTAYPTTDVVIMKFSADGSKLLYATFLGGKDSEVPLSLVANSKGELVVFGTTSSPNFPVGVDAFQKKFGGGQNWVDGTEIAFNNGSDIFVTILSKNGDAMMGSTFLGGSKNDGYNDTNSLTLRNYGDEFRGEVTLDSLDNIYIASVTASLDFPLVNASQSTPTVRGSGYEAVACKLNKNASSLLWSTFLGGNGYDAAYGIKVGKSGSIYICGVTSSTNLAVQNNALQKTNNGKSDGFVAKFTNNSLEQLSYLGTSQEDIADFVELDKQENVYIFGISKGTYPVSDGVYLNDKSGQFIHSLDKNLSKTLFSTVIGSGNSTYDIVPTAFLVNDCGNIYISGWGGKVDVNYNAKSTTKGLPITTDAIQSSTTGNNFYLAILESGAKSLLYATYYGSSAPTPPEGEVGDHLDGGTCRFDKNGVIYHAACSCKSRSGTPTATFPVTENAYQKLNNSSNCNMAGFKIDLEGLKAKFDITTNQTIVSNVCSPAKVDFTNSSSGAKTYEWQLDGITISRLQNPTQIPFNTPGTYIVKLKVYNKISCKAIDSTQRVLVVSGFQAAISADTVVCAGATVQLNASGGDKYVWSPSDFLNNTTIQNPVSKPNVTTKYTVTISKNGCGVQKSVSLKVSDTKSDFEVSTGKEICAGQSITLQVSGLATSFIWSAPNMKDTMAKSISVSPLQSTTYTVSAVYPDGCKPQKNIVITVDNTFQPAFDVNLVQSCNKPLHLVFLDKTQNATKEIWSMGNGDTLKTSLPDNYKYANAGTYKITLVATNKAGCVLSFSKMINIPENDGKIPNVITPNDDGKNDTFVVGFQNTTLSIYNRWGTLILESKNYQNDWGKGIDAGDYFYIIKSTNGVECKGLIQVVK